MNKFILPLLPALVALFFALPAQSMQCQQTTVRHYVNCKSECFGFTDPTILVKIDQCKTKERFGCKLDPCGAGFQCGHDPSHSFAVCGNDKTIFNELPIDSANDKNNPLKFLVDVNAPPLKVQYYFLVDTSQSMGPHIHMVKKKIKDLIDMYTTMPEIDATFALGEYRDPRFGGPSPRRTNGQCGLRHVRGFTNDIHGIKGNVDGLATATTGGNGPEGLLPSIVQVATNSGWSSGARKILIVLGDAPGYESAKHDIFWLVPSQIPFTIDRNHVANMLKDNDILYIGVNIGGSGLDGPTSPWTGSFSPSIAPPFNPGQSSFLAKETGGVVTSPSKTLMQAVIDAKESYEREYTMDASDCSTKLTINDGKEFRVKLKPAASSVVDMTMALDDAFCDPFDCNIKYFEDGIELVPLNMKFLKITGCGPV